MKTINNFRRAFAVVAILSVPVLAHASLNTDQLPEEMSQPLNTQITALVSKQPLTIANVSEGQSAAATNAFLTIQKASNYSTAFQTLSFQQKTAGHNEDW